MKFNLGLILVAFIVLSLLYTIRGDILKNRELNSQKQMISTRYEELMQKNQTLKELIQRSDQNTFIEREARQRLGYIKKGETAYQLCR